MKQLTLLRHAKSSWDNPDHDDFDRPLNERGRSAAPLMGAFMAQNGLLPDYILCSTAARTRETLKLILQAFDSAPRVNYSDDLYLSDPGTILAAVKAAPDDADHALVIVHNPGVHALALDLVDEEVSNKKAVRRLCKKFPTAALASFQFSGKDWRGVNYGVGALTLFVTPKTL